jgi:hypothetical protein
MSKSGAGSYEYHETRYKDRSHGRSLITKMPIRPTITRIRLENVIIRLNTAVATVEVVSKGLNTPFLGPIVTTMWSLLSLVQVTLAHLFSMGTDQL